MSAFSSYILAPLVAQLAQINHTQLLMLMQGLWVAVLLKKMADARISHLTPILDKASLYRKARTHPIADLALLLYSHHSISKTSVCLQGFSTTTSTGNAHPW